ncbi:MAG: SPFH domain-containing protein [Clostridia bacterium]|nr:SPFH domain-containing protein [Clostridia bacterium]
MGFFTNIIKGQLIDVIEWVDDSRDTIVYKYDMNGKEIMMGAQLTVRESQVAVFMNEGRIADVYAPGRYELTTANMPVMTALQSWKYGFNSPFKADVYFVNTRQFIDMKWGTSNPVMMRDAEFGMIRLRAFGLYSFRVSDPVVFLKEVFGTSPVFSTDDVDGQIKRLIVSGLSDAIAQSKIPALDLAANYDELGSYAMQALNPRLAPMGLALCTFAIENISLPQEVEEAMDRRTSMGVVGDLNRYTQFQAAEAMREAANNNDGGGSMAGMGVGMGAAAMMGQMFSQSMQGMQQAQPMTPKQVGSFCAQCGSSVNPGAKFCSNCGASQGAPKCSGCGSDLTQGAKFCSNCGQRQ